jgi:hydroxyacylglutathione hydrolase
MKRVTLTPVLKKLGGSIVLALVLSIGSAGWLISTGNAGQVKEINAKQLFDMMSSSKDLVIIDISTLGEYKEAHIKDSVVGDPGLIRVRTEQYMDSLGVKKSDTIILVCETGRKSYRAAEILLRTGYQNVYNLARGKIDWARNGYALLADDGKK